jgi:hypothetical protein
MKPARASRRGSPPKGEHAAEGRKGDWQAVALAHLRALIQKADPNVVEEVKWRKPSNPSGVPVWSRDGIICTGERYKDHLRLTFGQGAALPDPGRVFNSGFEGNSMRAIVLHEGDTIDEAAFQELIRAAAALNASSARH